ncbi:hypothetical protein [Bradyrhizobium sp. URHC0002]
MLDPSGVETITAVKAGSADGTRDTAGFTTDQWPPQTVVVIPGAPAATENLPAEISGIELRAAVLTGFPGPRLSFGFRHHPPVGGPAAFVTAKHLPGIVIKRQRLSAMRTAVEQIRR